MSSITRMRLRLRCWRTAAVSLPASDGRHLQAELRDEDGFVGDRASGRAFRAILEDWREKLGAHGEDPFGDLPTEEISKSKLDKMLAGADPLAGGSRAHRGRRICRRARHRGCAVSCV